MKKIRLLHVEDEPFLGKIVKESRAFEVHMVAGYLRDDPAIEIITIKGVGHHFAAG